MQGFIVTACRHLVRQALCALAILCVLAVPAAARNLALLIGISNYEHASITKLKAPGNDVRLMWDVLRERNFAAGDMTVLADVLAPGSETPARLLRPTAANILAELDRLIATVRQGDVVVVYYSGHGSYVPQVGRRIGETAEPSGLNQVLLAIDAGKFDPATGTIPGGIVDKTLKGKFDALKQKAFLWLVLDSCHAGGLTRDADAGVGVHFVDPADLGVPPLPAAAEVERKPFQNPWIEPQAGGKQVAFLAAPDDHPAYEKEIGAGAGHYGLFTHALATTLRAGNYSTYRQFARALARAQGNIPGNVPSPVFEGDLDQQMFDGSADGPRDWVARVDRKAGEVVVDAGALHGVRPGSIVAFQQGRTLLGYGEVVAAEIAASRVRPVAHAGRPAVGVAALPDGLVARVAVPSVSFLLKVARPPAADRAAAGPSRIAFDAIEQLVTRRDGKLPIAWVAAGDRTADLRLRVLGGVVLLVPATGELVLRGRRRTPAVAIGADAAATASELEENLWRVLRQQNLRRIAGEMRDQGLADAVEVRLGIVRDDAELAGLRRNEKQICKSWERPQTSLRAQPIGAGRAAGIRLTHCDRVTVEIVNRWPKAVDVTLLYLDSEGGIGGLASDQARIPPGQAHMPHVLEPIRIITWCDPKVWDLCRGAAAAGDQPIGTERLLVIIVEAEPGSRDARTFYYLAQRSLAKAKAELNTAFRSSGSPFDELLRSAGLGGEQTRGSVERIGSATMKIFTWEVVPPGELGRRR